MRLEDGKTYLDGEGKEVTVILTHPDTDYPFEGDNHYRYMADGRYIPEDDQPVSIYHLIYGPVNRTGIPVD